MPNAAPARAHTAEEIVTVLRELEVSIANGKATPQAHRQSRITEQTYYRCRSALVSSRR